MQPPSQFTKSYLLPRIHYHEWRSLNRESRITTNPPANNQSLVLCIRSLTFRSGCSTNMIAVPFPSRAFWPEAVALSSPYEVTIHLAWIVVDDHTLFNFRPFRSDPVAMLSVGKPPSILSRSGCPPPDSECTLVLRFVSLSRLLVLRSSPTLTVPPPPIILTFNLVSTLVLWDIAVLATSCHHRL